MKVKYFRERCANFFSFGLMAFPQRSWVTTASCFKPSSSVKSSSSKERESTFSIIPISDEEPNQHKHERSPSIFRKLTANCLKPPNNVDHSGPLNMSNQLFVTERSPKPFRSEEKMKPNSCKTLSSFELHSSGAGDKTNSKSSSYFTYFKSDNHGWCLKDKNKPKFRTAIGDGAPEPKVCDPSLSSSNSESGLCKSSNGFPLRKSLPRDHGAKRSTKSQIPSSHVVAATCEPAKKSSQSNEIVLKPIFCEFVSETIRCSTPATFKSVVLVDCRTFVVYNNNHIVGALNVSCSDCITRKRLLCGKIHIADLVTGPDDAKMRFKQSLADENVKLILYDEDTKDASTLPKTHPLKVISSSLCKMKKKVYYLKGGMKEFHKLASSLCVQMTNSPQFDSIIYSPTTQIVEDNIDAATISQILPFLYIGNERDSLNESLLRKCSISHVINVTSHLPMPLPDIKYKRLPASDSSSQNLKQYFEDAIQFIDEARRTEGKVLIHCQAGVSRSATIAMAYVMSRCSLTMMQAFKMVKKCRPIIAPNFNFLGQLLELESRLGVADPDCEEMKFGSCEELEDKMKDLFLSNGVQDSPTSTLRVSGVACDAP